MKRIVTGVVAGLVMATGSAAYGDCAADLAQMESTMSSQPAEGISKDGSVAPLQDAETTVPAATPGEASSDTNAASGNQIAKDGTNAPLETSAGEDTQKAMSGQDVQAQQQGEPTAAAQAATGGMADNHATALKEAREALDRGDEAACAAALEKAKAS